MRIYFPMTADVITPGHIKCIEWLSELNEDSIITIGLLTSKALKGYKKEYMSYADRLFILKAVLKGMERPVKVVAQNSLDPVENLIKYNQNAIASGDGWEKSELKAIKSLKLRTINITLPKEKGTKEYSSRKIKAKLWR